MQEHAELVSLTLRSWMEETVFNTWERFGLVRSRHVRIGLAWFGLVRSGLGLVCLVWQDPLSFVFSEIITYRRSINPILFSIMETNNNKSYFRFPRGRDLPSGIRPSAKDSRGFYRRGSGPLPRTPGGSTFFKSQFSFFKTLQQCKKC